MNSFSALIEALAVVILYIAIGILLNKSGMITSKNRSGFTDFCLKVTLPCMVFKSFLGDMTAEMLKDGASVLLLSAGVHVFAWAVGGLLYKGFPDNKKSIMKFALLVGNVGFVGLPLVSTAFGEMGSFYGSFYLISNVVFNWSVGIAFLSSGQKGSALIKKVCLNPGIIGTVLGVGRMLLGIALPAPVTTVITSLGGVTAPLGIILIGTILAECDVKSVFEKDVLYYAVTKLVMLPAVLWVCLKLSGIALNEAAYMVLMILTAMPAGTTTAILAEGYGQDHIFASKAVFVTTVLSLVTVPLMAAII